MSAGNLKWIYRLATSCKVGSRRRLVAAEAGLNFRGPMGANICRRRRVILIFYFFILPGSQMVPRDNDRLSNICINLCIMYHKYCQKCEQDGNWETNMEHGA